MAGRLGLDIATWILAALALMAMIDLIYQRWRYEERLKMTRKEVRDEHKEQEGDPGTRRRYRTRQLELSQSRMISAVAEATVVITNPTHFAVALVYRRLEMDSPKVVAKGKSHVAARIRAMAEKHGVPIVENPTLARILYRTCKIGREVPENLFQAVAEVLAYIYRLDPRRAAPWGATP